MFWRKKLVTAIVEYIYKIRRLKTGFVGLKGVISVCLLQECGDQGARLQQLQLHLLSHQFAGANSP